MPNTGGRYEFPTPGFSDIGGEVVGCDFPTQLRVGFEEVDVVGMEDSA